MQQACSPTNTCYYYVEGVSQPSWFRQKPGEHEPHERQRLLSRWHRADTDMLRYNYSPRKKEPSWRPKEMTRQEGRSTALAVIRELFHALDSGGQMVGRSAQCHS